MMSAAAALGLIVLWDIEGGLSVLDKYLYSKEDYVKVSISAHAVCFLNEEFLCCQFVFHLRIMFLSLIMFILIDFLQQQI